MKRATVAMVVGAALLLLAPAAPVLADNGPHRLAQGASTTPDSCGSCHRTSTASVSGLVRPSAQTALCYTCHGPTGLGATTDVQDGVQFAPVGAAQGSPEAGTTLVGGLRGGGFGNAAIDTALAMPGSTGGRIGTLTAPTTTTSRHDVAGAAGTAWGFGDISGSANAGTSIALTCGSCHDLHGNGRYRILKPTPENAYIGGYIGIASTPARMSNVSIADGATYVYTTTDYWHPEDTSTGNTYIANVSGWCVSCHTRYLAGTGAGSETSGDSVFTYRHQTNGTTFAGNSLTAPTCVQCHVAHGSNSTTGTYGATIPVPGGTAMGRDSSLLRIDNRGVCERCHAP